MNLKQAAAKLAGKTWWTDGKGLWTPKRKPVQVSTALPNFSGTPGDPHFEEYLLVYLEPTTWDTELDGLIYTDRAWLDGLRKALKEIGYAKWDKVNYTEQGTQGEDYVHLIVGEW
jgi:hypothetical protein